MEKEIKNPEKYSCYLIVGLETPKDFTRQTYRQTTDLFGEESTEVWCTDPGEEYVHESSLAVHVDSGICLRYEPNEDVMRKSSFPSSNI